MEKAVYIAGPMRGIERYNFPAFDAARNKLLDAGYRVISPADLDRAAGLDETEATGNGMTAEELRACIRRDLLAIVDECEAIALLPGWEKSSGVRVELELARFLGFKVFEVASI